MEYQGRCRATEFDKIGLKARDYQVPEKLQDNVYPEAINLLKGGIVYSDFVTTVSPSYAKEVKTAEGGKGMESTIVKYQDKFSGVLNGIDYSYWNPEIDRFLEVHFSSREEPANKKDRNTIDQKAYIKKLLRERLMLAEEYQAVDGMYCALGAAKGNRPDKTCSRVCCEQGGQFVLLGSSPIPSISADFHALKHQYADHPHVHLILHHQEELAHYIYAACD